MSEQPLIIPWDEQRARRHERGLMLPFVNADCGARQLQMHVSVIHPGQAPHAPHQHADEEIIFLLEGAAEVLLGTETHTIGPMTAVFCPANLHHGLRNCGPTPIKYLVLRGAEKPAIRAS